MKEKGKYEEKYSNLLKHIQHVFQPQVIFFTLFRQGKMDNFIYLITSKIYRLIFEQPERVRWGHFLRNKSAF